MILLKLLWLPVRMVFGTAKVSTKVGYRTGRLVGYRRIFFLAVGLAVGLLVAPVPGRELRARIRRRLEARGVTDADLNERVRFELAHHPRTWHLPQPDVVVAAHRVTLRGAVPDDEARHEIVRAAGALPGVAAVDDRLEVAGTAVSA
jgi:hypothetical protein